MKSGTPVTEALLLMKKDSSYPTQTLLVLTDTPFVLKRLLSHTCDSSRIDERWRQKRLRGLLRAARCDWTSTLIETNAGNIRRSFDSDRLDNRGAFAITVLTDRIEAQSQPTGA